MKRQAVYHFICAAVCSLTLIASACSQSSPIVVASPEKGGGAGVDEGTLYPMIQGVSPGSLQSLDIPEAVPGGILPSAPGICVVFSMDMENSAGEMSSAIKLYSAYDTTTPIAVTVGPSADARSFVVTPSAALDPQTIYQLRVYKRAFAVTAPVSVSWVARSSNVATITTSAPHGLVAGQTVNVTVMTNASLSATGVTVSVVDSTHFSYVNAGPDIAETADTGSVENRGRTLVFHNLVTAPATMINPADPAYVVYSFTTGTDTAADTVPPSLAISYPSNLSVNVDPTQPGGLDGTYGGYIALVFADNLSPVVDPSTVTSSSVTLRNDTDGAAVPPSAGGIVCTWDAGWKTFRFYTPALQSLKHYTMTISPAGNRVTDFAGNYLPETTISFSTQ